MNCSKLIVWIFLFSTFIACKERKYSRTQFFPKSAEVVEKLPEKQKVWVYIMAGQSNMAGRGQVEAKDTVSNKRILTINAEGKVIQAKEPLHFYEPNAAGLDCGLTFAKTIIKHIPADVSILIIPTAVGGSSISKWLGDSTHRKVQLLTNFHKQVEIGKQYGTVKALLWHQGEDDANATDIPKYKDRLGTLIKDFRSFIGNENLPVLLGELGSYSVNKDDWALLNQQIENYSASDPNSLFIKTNDLKNKGDKVHFDSKGQRTMGKRFADGYAKKFL